MLTLAYNVGNGQWRSPCGLGEAVKVVVTWPTEEGPWPPCDDGEKCGQDIRGQNEVEGPMPWIEG